jgi:hypothetical protein
VDEELDIVREALLSYRRWYSTWLEMRLTTDAEKQLATLKIALIDRELSKLPR